MHRIFALLLVAFATAAALACGKPPASSADRVKSGDRFVAEKKLPEALIEYRAAVQADDRNGTARRRLGEALALTGDMSRAADQLVRAADLMPQDMAVQLEAGRALLTVGSFEDARTRAETVLKANPKDVQAHMLRAASAAGLKDATGALAALDTAAQLDPNRGATFVDRAVLQQRTGKLQEAEAGFKQAIAVAPTSVDAHMALANFYWSTGRRAEAEDVLKKAAAANPKHAGVNISLANLYRATRRAAEAEAPLKAAVEASPADLQLKLALADYYVGEKKLELARPILFDLAKNRDSAAAAGARLAGVDYDSNHANDAYKRLDDLLKEQPGNAQLLTLKGNWKLKEGKFDEAMSLAQAAVKADQRSAPALYLLGSAHLATNNPEEAEKAFTAVLQVRPNAADALVAMTEINMARGRTDAALTAARQAVAAAPTDGTARLALARALFAHGDVAPAQAELKPVLASMPNSADAVALLGRIELRNGNAPAARQAFTRALELNPGMAAALASLLQMDLSAKRPADAVRTLEAHLAKSQRPDILVVAGRTYAAAGDLGKAEASLSKAIDQDPSMMEAYHVLGQVLVRQNKLEEAVKAYEERLSARPNDVGAQTMVGMILLVQGKSSEAKGRFEKILSIDPRAPVASNNLAYMDAEAGVNLDIALNRAQTAKAALPDDPDVNDTLGWVYVKRGLPALAVAPLEQAIQKKPSEPVYHYHLGMAYSKTGDKDRARPALERALRLSSSFQGAAEAKRTLDGLGR